MLDIHRGWDNQPFREHYLSIGSQKVGVPESFEQIKSNKEIGSSWSNKRAEFPIDPDMTLDRSTPLCHAMGLSTPDSPSLQDACLTYDVRGEDRPLAPDTDNHDII